MPTDEELQQHKIACEKLRSTFGDPGSDIWVPLRTISDYVVSLQTCMRLSGSIVKWQTEMLAYQKVIEIALHHLPPGHAITIENLLPVPEDYAKRASYYIDMGPDQLLYDISHGLTSYYGPGSTQGIPLVHASTKWTIASCGEQGCLLSTDGTHPMRVMLRVSIHADAAVWKGDSCIATLPDRVYVDQMYFYAVPWDRVREQDLQVSNQFTMGPPSMFTHSMQRTGTEKVVLSTPFHNNYEYDVRGRVKYLMRTVSTTTITDASDLCGV